MHRQPHRRSRRRGRGMGRSDGENGDDDGQCGARMAGDCPAAITRVKVWVCSNGEVSFRIEAVTYSVDLDSRELASVPATAYRTPDSERTSPWFVGAVPTSGGSFMSAIPSCALVSMMLACAVVSVVLLSVARAATLVVDSTSPRRTPRRRAPRRSRSRSTAPVTLGALRRRRPSASSGAAPAPRSGSFALSNANQTVTLHADPAVLGGRGRAR